MLLGASLLRVELDGNPSRFSVFLDHHVVRLGFDDVLDLVHNVVLLDDEPLRFGAYVLVLGDGQQDTFKARRVGAFAEELVTMRINAV